MQHAECHAYTLSNTYFAYMQLPISWNRGGGNWCAVGVFFYSVEKADLHVSGAIQESGSISCCISRQMVACVSKCQGIAEVNAERGIPEQWLLKEDCCLLIAEHHIIDQQSACAATMCRASAYLSGSSKCSATFEKSALKDISRTNQVYQCLR